MIAIGKDNKNIRSLEISMQPIKVVRFLNSYFLIFLVFKHILTQNRKIGKKKLRSVLHRVDSA